jgi:hypothetical protein
MLRSVAGFPQHFQRFPLTVGASVRHDLQHGDKTDRSPKTPSSGPLREDPERYEIAYFLARQSPRMRFYAPRPTRLAKIVMQASHGIVDTTEERAKVADALLDGRDFRIEMRKVRGGNDPTDNEQWRNRDSGNAYGDNFRKKAVTRLEKLPVPSDAESATNDEKDARWLSLMMKSWHLVAGVYSYQGSAFAAAADLAAKAGEPDYFRRVMAPIFFAHEFAGFHAPDLFPKEVA